MGSKTSLEHCLSCHYSASQLDSEKLEVRIVHFEKNDTALRWMVSAGYRTFYGKTLGEIKKDIEEFAKFHDRIVRKILTIKEAEELQNKAKTRFKGRVSVSNAEKEWHNGKVHVYYKPPCKLCKKKYFVLFEKKVCKTCFFENYRKKGEKFLGEIN